MELKKPESLNKQEIDFCELFIFGCDPYAGNARKCYEDIFYDSSHTSLRKAKQLMARDDVQEYINQLRAIANYETADLKARLTEKLLHIIDETSTAKYTDRRGTELSPAPLRSVAVQASKALMEMYPVKVAQESKVELKGNGDSGIVFNVIVPQSNNDNNVDFPDPDDPMIEMISPSLMSKEMSFNTVRSPNFFSKFLTDKILIFFPP